MPKGTTKVAIITSNYWPEKTGIGQVTTEFAEYLCSNGIKVAVATAAPYYPEWRIAEQYRGRLWQTEEHNGVLVHRAAHHAAPNPGTISRLLHELTLCAFSIPNMIRALSGTSESFIVSPDLSHAFVGSVIARMMGKPFTAVIQDVMPDAAIEMGMLRNPLLVSISRSLARRLYARAHRIFTLSEGMKQRIQRAGVKAKVEIVPNTVDETEFDDRPGLGSEFRSRFVANGKFAVLHTGNMGEKQDLPLLLRTARRLRNKSDIGFFVFGDGAFKPAFLELKKAWKLANLSHFPLQDRSLLPHMLRGADVCLVSQTAQVVDVVVPSKLITAMAAGAMIVAACPNESETAKVLRACRGGLIIPPGDDAQLARLLNDVQAGRIKSLEYRRRARDYALANFSRAKVYGPIAQRMVGSSL